MSRFLLDAGIASDCINRRLGVRERVKAAARTGGVIGIGMPVLGELAAGVEMSDAPERRMKELIHELGILKLWPFDKASAFRFGKLRAHLRRVGRPMQQTDIQIAAIALTLGNCAVVTKDSDFEAVPGLQTEDWSV